MADEKQKFDLSKVPGGYYNLGTHELELPWDMNEDRREYILRRFLEFKNVKLLKAKPANHWLFPI